MDWVNWPTWARPKSLRWKLDTELFNVKPLLLKYNEPIASKYIQIRHIQQVVKKCWVIWTKMVFQFEVSLKQNTTFGFQAAVLKWRGSSTRAPCSGEPVLLLACASLEPGSQRTIRTTSVVSWCNHFFFKPKFFCCLVSFWLLDMFTFTLWEVVFNQSHFEIWDSFLSVFCLIFGIPWYQLSVQLLDLVCARFTCRALVLQPSWTTREEIPTNLGGGSGWKAVKEGAWH